MMICPIWPSSAASNSIVALSVSISARMSPGFTASPGFTSHLASVPFSIVGESAGIVSSIAISVSKKEFGGGIDDRVGIQPVGAVKIGQIAGLAKTIGAKRRNAHARHTTQQIGRAHV